MTLYDWPRAAAFGRVIPKNKIYEHAGASTGLKDLFVREVDQIVWSHKLAPETVNLVATKQVAEIQVFRLTARTATLDTSVLRAIDKAIPFPLIFEVAHGGRVRLAAAYKRPSEADSARWVVGDYFQGDWLPEDAARAPLPVALNMGSLYERLLEPLVAGQTARLIPGAATGFGEVPQGPLTPAEAERPLSLDERIAQAEEIKAQTREVERIAARLGRETPPLCLTCCPGCLPTGKARSWNSSAAKTDSQATILANTPLRWQMRPTCAGKSALGWFSAWTTRPGKCAGQATRKTPSAYRLTNNRY